MVATRQARVQLANIGKINTVESSGIGHLSCLSAACILLNASATMDHDGVISLRCIWKCGCNSQAPETEAPKPEAGFGMAHRAQLRRQNDGAFSAGCLFFARTTDSQAFGVSIGIRALFHFGIAQETGKLCQPQEPQVPIACCVP